MQKQIDLKQYGIQHNPEIVYNPDYALLYREETRSDLAGFAKGRVSQQGAVAVCTGEFTGRSPKDKYFVHDETSRDTIWWPSEAFPNDNRPMSPEVWASLKSLVSKGLSHKRLFVVDTFCGANPATRLKVRFVMEIAWQAHFVKNMFIQPTQEELEEYGEPDFVVLNASRVRNPDWQTQGLNSEVFTAFNLSERMQIIGGTWYGGEMKKGLFSIMNYYLPQKGIASMHCSANVGERGDVAIFFGLSGTGKTTLSTDAKRQLIGDDEHGWDDEGVFNFEGGCYAKTIDLDPEDEPEIYQAIKRDALLENVVLHDDDSVDYSDRTLTENTRVSYPLSHIENRVKPVSKGGHPQNILFLTADAFGVLPPVSVLDYEQAKYYFLSGFTAKMAGTERGIKEPQPTFSACFGQAFLSLHPLKYAEVLAQRMTSVQARVFLVNTGWNGSGKRYPIKVTRKIIDAILDGSINRCETSLLPVFNLRYPSILADIDASLLNPIKSYSNPFDWYDKSKLLAERFISNFSSFREHPDYSNLTEVGPQLEEEQLKSQIA